MALSTELLFISSNFSIENIKNGHQIAIFNNFRYWWKCDNKDMSARYVCSEKDCYASIRIKDNQVVKQGGKHYHEKISESELKILNAQQDLKKEVILTNFAGKKN